MHIEKANVKDSSALTDLTLRSKAFWGYSDQQMEEWTGDLEVSKNYIETNWVYLIKIKNKSVGYYSFQRISRSKVKLDNLFIDPSRIGTGLGKLLMDDFLQRVKRLNFEIITLDADPHAEAFYSKFGFKTIDQLPSSVSGRTLPVMELRLE